MHHEDINNHAVGNRSFIYQRHVIQFYSYVYNYSIL